MTFTERQIWKMERASENLCALSYGTAASALAMADRGKGAMVVASETMKLRKYLLDIAEESRFDNQKENDRINRISLFKEILTALSLNARIEGHQCGLRGANEVNSLLAFCSQELTQAAIDLFDGNTEGIDLLQSEDYPRVINPTGDKLETLIVYHIGVVPFYEKLDHVREILLSYNNINKIDKGKNILVRGHKWKLIDSYAVLELPRPSNDSDINIICIFDENINDVTAIMTDRLRMNCIFESPEGADTEKGILPVEKRFIRKSWATTDSHPMNFLDWKALSQV